MVVSDSGLASTEPQWWNASPLGCFLIGLQPRGGWQVMQRAVQWGEDRWTHAFGVKCPKPILYAYFACSIRNRLEVWDSTRFTSPMEGEKESETWKSVGASKVARPTKLIDGSRGGQAFICGLLRPEDNKHYGIEQQARMQLLSVMLVAAGFMGSDSYKNLKMVMREDFEVSDRLGIVFYHLFRGLLVASLLDMAFVITVFYTLWRSNIYGESAPYVVQLSSLASWAVGAVGLLMLGGNPRVRIVDKTIPLHVEIRLRSHETENPGKVRLEFGSIHGSVYTPDRGHCFLPPNIVRSICGWDLKLRRTSQWYLGLLWFSLVLLMSIVLQISGLKVTTAGSGIMSIVFLLATSVLRGSGVSGREEWLIPRWKRRGNANYGARLQGAVSSRGGRSGG